MKIVGTLICFGSVGLFYWVFFKLAPGIASLVPQGDWSGLAKIAIYIAIGYLGGIGLPFALFLLGMAMIIGIFR